MIWASITLAAAIYMSIVLVAGFALNIISGIMRTKLKILKMQDPKLQDMPDLKQTSPIGWTPIVVAVLWGVFFYLTR